MQLPIFRPSGEQIDWPGVVQDPAEELDDAEPEPETGAAFEPDVLSAAAGTGPVMEGGAATEGAVADVEVAVVVAAAAGDDAAAASPEAPGLPALEA